MTDIAELDRWCARARAAGRFRLRHGNRQHRRDARDPTGLLPVHRGGQGLLHPHPRLGGLLHPRGGREAEACAACSRIPALRIVAQNAKYDYKVMRRWGVRPAHLHFDTMVAAWVLDSDLGSYGLDRMAETRLAFRTMPYAELVGKGQTLADLPLQAVTDYSGEDADLTLRLSPDARVRAGGGGPGGAFLLAGDAAGRGARGNGAGRHPHPLPRAGRLRHGDGEGPRPASRTRSTSSCGRQFNIASTKQLQEILFTWRKLTPVKKTKTGSPRTWTCWRPWLRRTPCPRRSSPTASSPSSRPPTWMRCRCS